MVHAQHTYIPQHTSRQISVNIEVIYICLKSPQVCVFHMWQKRCVLLTQLFLESIKSLSWNTVFTIHIGLNFLHSYTHILLPLCIRLLFAGRLHTQKAQYSRYTENIFLFAKYVHNETKYYYSFIIVHYYGKAMQSLITCGIQLSRKGCISITCSNMQL